MVQNLTAIMCFLFHTSCFPLDLCTVPPAAAWQVIQQQSCFFQLVAAHYRYQTHHFPSLLQPGWHSWHCQSTADSCINTHRDDGCRQQCIWCFKNVFPQDITVKVTLVNLTMDLGTVVCCVSHPLL